MARQTRSLLHIDLRGLIRGTGKDIAIAVKKYNPGFLSDDELVTSFCVRTAEFESLVEMLRENTGRSNTHAIVIGPRGSGKTHLLLRVAAEMRRDSGLGRLFPIVFAEESYEVGTCGEFWLECLRHLSEQAPVDERADLRLSYDDLRSVMDDRALAERCLASLLDFADRHSQRLVLIVENLNTLLSDVTDEDTGWQLRKILQTEPRIMMLGSATSRFQQIDDPDEALFDLFRVVVLQPLDTDECETLWAKVSGSPSDSEAIRAVEMLTGGNPRLIAVLATFGAGYSFGELMRNLLDLVDDHTEYFRSHLEVLAPQERRVYLALARLWKPATTREVADLARIDTNRCSVHLNRLVERGAVTIEGGTARRRQYYLSERLYNIYYLLRRAGGADKMVQSLIDFMVCMYTPSQLADIVERSYAQAVVQAFGDPGIVELLSWTLLRRGGELGRAGQVKEALGTYDAVLRYLSSDEVPSAGLAEPMALFWKGFLYSNNGQFSGAAEVYRAFIDRYSSRTEAMFAPLVVVALDNLGHALARSGHVEESLRAYDQALEKLARMEPEEARLRSTVTVNRALTLLLTSRTGEALTALDSVVERYESTGQDESKAILAHALVARGLALVHIESPDTAITAFDDAVHRLGQDPEPAVRYWVSQAITTKYVLMMGSGQSMNECEAAVLLESLSATENFPLGTMAVLIEFSAAVGPSRALEMIRESGAEDLLLPLVTALRQELGQEPRVAREVDEVARDIRDRLQQFEASPLGRTLEGESDRESGVIPGL